MLSVIATFTVMRKHIALLFITIFILLAVLPYGTDAQETNQAALVIDYGGGNVEALCVDFTEPEITGYELLVRSGLAFEIDFAGSNRAVCNINGTGCPASDCFCQCRGGDNCTYWTYWHRNNNEWVYSQVGSPLYPITHGDVEGWAWGLSSITERQPPPNRSFAEICQAEPATETPTSTPKPTVVIPVIPTDPPESPTAVATARPTETNTPIPSPTPEVSPTIAASEEPAAESLPSPSATIPAAGQSPPSVGETTLDATPPPAGQPTTNVAEADSTASTPLTPDLAAEALLVEEAASDSPAAEAITATPVLIETATTAPAVVAAPILEQPEQQLSPSPTPVVTVIGALAAVTEQNTAAVPPMSSATNPAVAQAIVPETSWLSYVVFLLICISLGCLLLIGRLRQKGESAK